MSSPIRIEQPALLLVEGKDEENFFSALNQHLNLRGVQIIPVGGKQRFRNTLKFLVKLANFDRVQSIGLVRDSDGNAKGAFTSLCDSLQAAGLPRPRRVLLPTTDSPRVTVIIIPPDYTGTNRMLEDLCLASIANHPATPCVDQYLDCLERQGISIEPNSIAKARVQAFLASMKEASSLGIAALQGHWNWDDPVFDKVKTFLRQVALQSDNSD